MLTRLLAVVLALSRLCARGRAAGLLWPNRYAFQTCSLVMELEENCQVKSIYGKDYQANSFQGLLMNFGEINCSITIKQCFKNTCYSFRDLTSQLPTDALAAGTTGFFRSVRAVSGAHSVSVSREGVSFYATSDTVSLLYSTQTCQDFYRVHGGVEQQLCNQPIQAITSIDSGAPNSLNCS